MTSRVLRAAPSSPAKERVGIVPTPGPPLLSVVVPVYDEAPGIGARLDRLLAFLRELEPAFELIVVDDGSRDGSGGLVAQRARREPRLVTLDLGRHRGKGAAVRRGVLASRGERVLVMDADLSTDLACARGVLDALGPEAGPEAEAGAGAGAGAEVVYGSRRAPGAVIERPQGILRRVLGAGFSGLARRLLGLGLGDVTCGFKGFRGDAARALFARCVVDGWAFDAEVALAAMEGGLGLVEVPVRWAHRDGSRVRPLGAALRATLDLTRLSWRRLRGAYRPEPPLVGPGS